MGASSGIAARVAELTEGADEDERLVIKMVLETYLEKLPERLAAVVDAAAQDDLDTLGTSAHSLKGASSNVGATRVADVAARIEQLAHAADGLEPARALLADLSGAADDEAAQMHDVALTLA